MATQARKNVRKLRDWVSVKDFGAVGDGVADDTGAINDALGVGGTVYFPVGVYLAGSTIVVPRGVRLVGAGRERTKLLKGFNGTLLTYGTETTFSDMTIDGQRSSFTGRLMQPNNDNTTADPFAGHRHLSFERIEIVEFDEAALELREIGSGFFNLVRFNGGNDYAIEETQGTIGDRCRYMTWISCEVRNAKGAVHSIGGSRDSSYDIRVQSCTEHAYKIEGTHQNNEYRNLIGGNNGSAFYCTASLARPILRARIVNNLQSPPGGDYSGDPAQIYFAGVSARQDLMLLGGQLGPSPANPDLPIKSDSGGVTIVNAAGVLRGALHSSVRLFDMSPAINSVGDLDRSGAARALEVVAGLGGSDPSYFRDAKSGKRLYVGSGAPFVTADRAVGLTEYFTRVNASSGAVTVTLPSAADAFESDRAYEFVKTDVSANTVTVQGSGGANISGESSVVLRSPRQSVIIRSDGANWWRTDGDPPLPDFVPFVSSNRNVEVYERFTRIATGSGNVTVTLPSAAAARGREYTFQKTAAANSAIIDGGGANINGAPSVTLTSQYQTLRVFSDGSAWWRSDLP